MVEQMDPKLTQPITVVSQDLSQIASIITQVEAMGQALGIAGPDKLRAASPLVAQIILQSALLANHSISDGPLFTQGTTKVADGMADILNALKDNITVTNKAV